MAGRPPAVPSSSSGLISLPTVGHSWTVQPNKTKAYRRALSATALHRGRAKAEGCAASSPESSANGYDDGQFSDRLRGAGSQVVRTPPSDRKPSRNSDGNSTDPDTDQDLHADCRTLISAKSAELEKESEKYRILQRDYERVLRQLGNEREEYRVLKRSEQEAVLQKTQLKRYREEMLCMRDERDQHAKATAAEEQAAAHLRLALQASEEREQRLQSALSAEELAEREAAQKMRGTLRTHEDSERFAVVALADQELLFAKLEAKCSAQDEFLRERASEFNAFTVEYAAVSTSEAVLRREVDEYRHELTAGLDAALSNMKASEEQSAKRKVGEVCSERDEARKQATFMRKGEDAAKTGWETVKKKLNAAKQEQSESQAMQRANEQEMQEIQSRNTKFATKKEAEVRMLQTQLDQSKAEIQELYDALVRAGENQGTTKKGPERKKSSK